MKKSVIAIFLTASLLLSATSCVKNPDASVTETLPRITGGNTVASESAVDTETAAPTETSAPSYDFSAMTLDEVEAVLLQAAGSGDAITDYVYAIEENADIGLVDGRTYSYYMMDENPDVFGGFNIFVFDTNNPNFQNMQVGDFIHVSYMYGEDLFSGEQYITAINGPYVFSAWETPRGGNYNNSAPFQCNEIQAAYNAFAG